MLSSSSTITDVKKKLSKNYSDYGYEIENQYDEELISIAEDVERIYFYSKIGEDKYTEIQEKDKIDLTSWETNLYYAEVFTICTEFLRVKSAIDNQFQSSSKETLKVEGYSYQTDSGGGSSGSSLHEESIKKYSENMYVYWKRAGFNLYALERTCTIFGDTPDYTDLDTTS